MGTRILALTVLFVGIFVLVEWGGGGSTLEEKVLTAVVVHGPYEDNYTKLHRCEGEGSKCVDKRVGNWNFIGGICKTTGCYAVTDGSGACKYDKIKKAHRYVEGAVATKPQWCN